MTSLDKLNVVQVPVKRPWHDTPKIHPPGADALKVGSKEYVVELEVAADEAIWSRPDSGDCTISLPFPCFSQSQGLFKTILATMSAEVVPVECRICAPLIFHTITTNYRGPLRHPARFRESQSEQQRLTVLLNVVYQLTAMVRHFVPPPHLMNDRIRKHIGQGQHGPHAYVEMFNRRLNNGNYFHTPFLGQKEFTCRYVGPFRPETQTQENLSFVVPSVPFTVFDGYRSGKFNPTFKQNVRIEKGVIHYGE